MNPPFSRPLAILGFAIVIATGAVTSVVAAEVQFDVEPLIACVDVTDEGFLALHADERLVEARIRLSTLVRFGLRSEDLRIFIAVHTGSESIEDSANRILDYLVEHGLVPAATVDAQA